MSETNYRELFHFASQAFEAGTFYVTHFQGTEGLNTLFCFSIELVSKDPAIDTDKLLNAPAVFTIHREDGKDAVFHGYLSRVEQGGMFNTYAYYKVELRPAFWKFTQVVQSAIFLNKTVQQVAEELVNGEQFFRLPHEFRFTRQDYPAQEFAMQYGESIYEYILWRMEEQGAYFYFAQDSDRIIFADTPQSHAAPTVRVTYSPTSGLEGNHREEVLIDFTLAQTPLPRRVVVRTFDWKNPEKVVLGSADVASDGLGDVYLTDENVESDEEATRIAKIRSEELVCRSRVFSGAGSVPCLRPGVVFSLEAHYNDKFNRDYLVTEINHQGSQESFLTLGLGIPLREKREHLFYRNTFSCIESDVPYRPARKALRAKISGVIRAFVDGAGSGARAEMDSFGRYKILFPFDISGRSAGNASCWIRMAQPQVGKDSGLGFPLLPGTEVTVAFLGGNPDRPVITGALANGGTGSITGQGNVNFSGIRTPGGNQITFNDTDNKQGISLLSASGLGLSFADGSPNTSTWTTDNAISAAGLCSNDLTGMCKNLYSGYKTTTAAAKDRKWFAFLPTLISGVGQAASDALKSLSQNAAKAKDANGLAWGSDITTLVTTVLSSGLNIYTAKMKPTSYYNVAITGSKSMASSTLQVSPSKAKLMGYIGAWAAIRAASLGLEEAAIGLKTDEEVDKAKAGKDYYDQAKDKHESVQEAYQEAEKAYQQANTTYQAATLIYNNTTDSDTTIETLHTQILEEYENATSDYEAAKQKYESSSMTADDEKEFAKAEEEYNKVKARYDAIETLYTDPSLRNKSIKDVYNDEKSNYEKAEKTYNGAKNLYDSASDKNESIAKAYEESKDYKSWAIQKAVREGAIQQLSSLLTDITALVTLLITMAPKDEELGGVTLSSSDRNININAAKTISLHGCEGIFLNTHDFDGKGKWGISTPAEGYAIGKTKKATTPFVALYTTNRYSEATTNEELYDTSKTTADSLTFQHKNENEKISIKDGELGLQSSSLVFKVQGDNKPSIKMIKDGISLYNDANDKKNGIAIGNKNISINKKNGQILIDDNCVVLKSNSKAKISIGQSVVLKPANNKVHVGNFLFQGSKMSTGEGGMIDFGGGAVKIMGSSAGAAESSDSSENSVATFLSELFAKESEAEQEAKMNDESAQNKANVQAKADHAKVEAQNIENKAKDALD